MDVRRPLPSPPLCGPHPHPPVRSCVCSANPPPCLCCYAARARPRPTRARPRQENPPHPRGWRRRLRNTAAPPRSERNVVSAGARLRDRPQAREARGGAREVQELGEGAPSPSPSSVHGKVDRETARAGSLGTEVQGWKETGRGLSWCSGRADWPRAPGRSERTSDLSALSPPPLALALRPAEPSSRFTVCSVGWFVCRTREPGFYYTSLPPHTHIQKRVHQVAPPRAWCRPGAFKPQPQGKQTWRRYLPLKVEATGYSSPTSRASCWEHERGSYLPHLKLCWSQLCWLLPASTIPHRTCVPGCRALLGGGGMVESWPWTMEAALARVCRESLLAVAAGGGGGLACSSRGSLVW